MPEQRPRLPSIEMKPREMKDPGFLDLDQSTLNPDRHYRWVRCRSDEHMISIVKTKLLGYSIETLEGGVKPLADFDKRPDGVIAVGDLILMSCPIDKFEGRQKKNLAKSDALFASAIAQTQQMAKEKGISILADSDHNI